MVGHQEAGAERPDHLHLVAHLQVAHVVRANAAHGVTVVVLQHALDRQRQVVVARPLAVARTGDGVLARVVRAAAGVGARRHDADRLAFEHRERRRAEIQHDVVRVIFAADIGHTHIAGHRGGDGLVCGLGAIDVGVGMRGGPRRHGGAIAGAVEGFLAGAGQRRRGGNLRRGGLRPGAGCQVGQLLWRQFFWQRVPGQLLFDAVGAQFRHIAPVVDRAGRTRGNAGHAQVALVGIDHIVA
ncbi:hypothetical protein D9M72_487870 [compost metagenome]